MYVQAPWFHATKNVRYCQSIRPWNSQLDRFRLTNYYPPALRGRV